jgi:lipopolysaccharide/colanic/teichoic acid biosynthesis glycosyltransferase
LSDSTPGGERTRSRTAAASDRGRRVLNIVVALVLIALTAPLMIVVAVLVKLGSPGPAIYTQPRVGLDRRGGRASGRAGERRRDDLGGRIFTIYKFRTMTLESRGAKQRWATKDDARVTRLGRILRATRIDELPQLFNVLKGDMNIVGPRPEQPEIFGKLREEVDAYHERQKVLPGITGWAQVNQGYDTSVDDVRRKVELDLEYIGKRSAVEDLAIMARTFPVMVGRKVWTEPISFDRGLRFFTRSTENRRLRDPVP